MTEQQLTQLAQRTWLETSLRQASRERHDRGARLCAVWAGIAIAALVCALNFALPFLPR